MTLLDHVSLSICLVKLQHPVLKPSGHQIQVLLDVSDCTLRLPWPHCTVAVQ